MPLCGKCDDRYEYDLYEDQFGKYHIGIKLDVNVYREHICKVKQVTPKKYWCIKCGEGGAPIPIDRPCIHRQPQVKNQSKTLTGMDKFM